MRPKKKHYYRISRKPLMEQYNEATSEGRRDSPRSLFLREIADVVNVTTETVKSWMTGKTSPSAIYRRMLAIYYKTPECMLFKGMKPLTKWNRNENK